VFVEIVPGIPDGIRVDTDGNVWASAGDGVHCYSPAGQLLGKIRTPQVVANLEFGDGRLFIAATTTLYAVRVSARDGRE
ncbi:MAG: SMP-30/gluconolactonase/LRE family protein, partial [Myxococcales bacterium]|nr:SMP-30/gluconolactonase/LRE family protein [Myxococcales bacterium]